MAGSEAIQVVEKTRKNRLIRYLKLDCFVTSFLAKTEKERVIASTAKQSRLLKKLEKLDGFRYVKLDCFATSFLAKTEKERLLQKAFSRERSVAGSEDMPGPVIGGRMPPLR